jgi:hypothetical protein
MRIWSGGRARTIGEALCGPAGAGRLALRHARPRDESSGSGESRRVRGGSKCSRRIRGRSKCSRRECSRRELCRRIWLRIPGPRNPCPPSDSCGGIPSRIASTYPAMATATATATATAGGSAPTRATAGRPAGRRPNPSFPVITRRPGRPMRRTPVRGTPIRQVRSSLIRRQAARLISGPSRLGTRPVRRLPRRSTK